jgi:AcrR family transcriptional regulator
VNPPTNSPARRSQSDRSAATRQALLQAAIECLVVDGYAGTTTANVSARAGLSRGAHLHHFGTRAALLAAALAELARQRDDRFVGQIGDLPTGAGRAEHALDLLWNWFNGSLFHAAVDLAAAARTDGELRASLAPVERQLNESTLLNCRELFAGNRSDSNYDTLIRMTIATIRGLALLPILQPGTQSANKQWAFARTVLLRLFEERRGAVGGW